MTTWRNNPSIDRKYNYLYVITNTINEKIYVGVHRTDQLNDGYMGSGTLIRRSIEKYGIENFKKEIIIFFDTYQEALDMEKYVVDEDFINSDNVYNIREGGYGYCIWNNSSKKIISEKAKERWNDPEYEQKMLTLLRSEERRKNVSKGLKKFNEENPEKRQEWQMKINKNPEKIRKMAEKHRGMKRSEESKEKMSIAAKNRSEEDMLKVSGKGGKYIYNLETKQVKRLKIGEDIPEGWGKGTGPKDPAIYKGRGAGAFFIYNINTLENKKVRKGSEIPEGWALGFKPKKK